MLIPGQDPPISLDYFLETCGYTMKETDVEIMLGAKLVPGDDAQHPAIARWNDWERTLRNELANARAAKTGIDAEKYHREGNSTTGVAEPVREALSATNPAAAEAVLDAARWRFLDEVEASHNFDLTKLIVYYIRLQIAERAAVMNRKHGEENYQEIYKSITEKIHQAYDGE